MVKDVSEAKVVRAKAPVVSCNAHAAESGIRSAVVFQCPLTTLVEGWGAVTSFWHESRATRPRMATATDARERKEERNDIWETSTRLGQNLLGQ
jgi:hypothetical protein